ncbi:MAG: amino acid adenylation domain-containing protein [Legionellaceae bacterium]|nr:amino acid adenylation domain-containing protein [Legionellaceae bacterium]
MKKYTAHNNLLPLYLAHQLEAHANTYNLCFSYQLKDEDQVHLVIEKLQKLIKLQAYLRQTFTLAHNKVIARTHADLPAEIKFFTSSAAGIENLEKRLIIEPHEIGKNSSIQLNIITVTDSNSYIALFNIHHILMDGYSLETFITDLNQLIAGKEITKESAEAYITRLANELPLYSDSDHPGFTDYLKSVNDIANNMECFDANHKTDVLYYTEVLSDLILKKLVTVGAQFRISTFNLLLLAWGVFLAKLSNQKQILVNYPVNIRTDKSIAGCFINTVIMPLNLASEDTYLSVINSWVDNADFFKQIARLQLSHGLSVGPISSFASSHFAKPIDLMIEDTYFKGKGYAQIANSNISIKYREYQSTLTFSCDILVGIFPEYVLPSLLPRFFNFLNKLLDTPTQLLSRLDLTFPLERRQVLCDFNNTLQAVTNDKTLIDLFEEQVERTPENIALVFEDIRFTYTELNSKANQLSHYLIHYHQVKPDDLIALLLDRNEHTLIAILAALKTGGAYVPIDLGYPQERIEYILDDTEVKIILVNEVHQDRLEHLLCRTYCQSTVSQKNIDIVAIDSKKIQTELTSVEKTNIVTADTSANLAYVIYTSGTTGKPKGVMIEHRGVVNTLHSMAKVYQRDIEKRDCPLKITAFTSYAFDVSISEFFVPLLQGDELHLLNNTLRQDIILTGKYIHDNKINYLYLPPVLLANLPRIKYPSLKGIIYAGEPCDRETALYWSHKTKLYNYYGPTETSIYATGLQLMAGEVNLIGKPLANTSTYVLNTEMTTQPIGIIGELYIGGAGVAKGYLNQTELMAERFIDNPFQTEEEKVHSINFRLYKTGDLVRWLPDGNIEYISRNDFQVKIRGYRIELGEIEATIAAYPGIKQVVVLVKKQVDAEDTNICHQFLVGYYVADQSLDQIMLQDHLALHLPDYMQPTVLIQLNHLPVTTNGKLDRGALPTPDFTQNDSHIPPTNDKEALICKAFSKILLIDKIGISDDFFKLGGNSISAINLISNLQANCNINVADIFNLKTPKKIAKTIPFIKDNLRKNLEKIRLGYNSAIKNNFEMTTELQNKLDSYIYAISPSSINFSALPISNVLLTGATGFLGCNLLNSLLTSSEYSVFLLVRANSHAEAFERVNHKFKFYFDQSLEHFHNQRLFVYAGNIEKSDLGITREDYGMLVEQIDSVIHSAALTKHYGDYDTFYSANVQATINLLEFSKLTKLKNFHYISTSSVLNEGYVPNYNYYIFTEDDDGDNLEERSNIYVKTKYEGERIVVKYRKHGICSNIYRVGNLAFILSNCRAQENIEENAFFTRIKCLINLKIVAPEIGMEEISPVDLTAAAIVKLFDKEQISNNTFHIFNPELYNLGAILSQKEMYNVRMVTINQFISTIIRLVDKSKYQKEIELFLLHRGWLNETHRSSTNIRILQDRTHAILKHCGFEWMPITDEAMITYLKREIGCDKQS